MKIPNEDIQLWQSYQNDWNKLASEVFGVTLDEKQKEIVTAVQNERRVSVRSGHARGKDYVAAVISLCFLYSYYPSKVISTAPTGRQVLSIMMTETSKIHKNAKILLPGEVLKSKVRFKDDPDWFLEGFKAKDKATEEWTGFHSPNILVVITEASGIETETFEAVEGLLTGNSRLLIIFNPNRTTGEAYQSTRSPRYKKFKLNCLDAPNVLAKKILIPGQVDYEWVEDKIDTWCVQIEKEEMNPDNFDFAFDGKYYRPNDLFRVKVLGEFPAEAEGQLIPLSWVEMANERWLECKGKGEGDFRLGVDVAGMGRDSTVFTFRRGNVIEKMISEPKSNHMATVGKIINYVGDGKGFIDSIGEGAGVYSRAEELKVNVQSVKGSESAKDLSDFTRAATFANMRAYIHWCLRDALNPEYGINLALPPDEMLTQELTEPRYDTRSNGDIIIEPKDKIIERLKRSPDKMDSITLTFAPDGYKEYRILAV